MDLVSLLKPMFDPSSAAPRGREATVEEARLRQQAIGSKLRQIFDDVVNEPVPDDFLEILRRGDRRRTGGEA